MRAITIHNPWASLIARGEKTLEIRSWKTSYRGDVLIASSARPLDGYLRGAGLCVVRLTDVRTFVPEDSVAAHIPFLPDLWAWVLTDVRVIAPFPVRGKQGFYEVNIPKYF